MFLLETLKSINWVTKLLTIPNRTFESNKSGIKIYFSKTKNKKDKEWAI